VTDRIILDRSSIVALFDSYPTVYGMAERAVPGEPRLMFPAIAVSEAAEQMRSMASAWGCAAPDARRRLRSVYRDRRVLIKKSTLC
jgi:hypothetical protein